MRSREEYGLTIRLHDMKIKGLDEKVKSQADMTDKMEDEVISLGKEVRRLKKLHLENEVESLREMMKGLMKEVKELNRLKAEMKGYVAAEKVKTSMRIKSK
jgi:phage shock protein A